MVDNKSSPSVTQDSSTVAVQSIAETEQGMNALAAAAGMGMPPVLPSVTSLADTQAPTPAPILIAPVAPLPPSQDKPKFDMDKLKAMASTLLQKKPAPAPAPAAKP